MITQITIIFSTILTLPFINNRWKWTSVLLSLFITSFLSYEILNNSSNINILNTSIYSLNFITDNISGPLIQLTCWIAPLCLLANNNIKYNNKESTNFLIIICLITIFLILAFASINLLLFFIFFEATLIPTFVLITRLGSNIERINASFYFIYYTMTGSLPLLVSILLINNNMHNINILLLNEINNNTPDNIANNIWYIITILAFLIKIPIYGFHLWLPKAHVEAPVSGSMILAAILLKLGSYGLIRLAPLFTNNWTINSCLIVFCAWGALISSIMCLRQTDLKALIAYSSVSHMSLTTIGILIFSDWTATGAIILMVSHGLVSSALFCLANILYERTNTRNITLNRGFKVINGSILPAAWLFFCICNLALPPTPNFNGEIFLITGAIKWSIYLAPILGITTVISAVYSLTIYQTTNNSRNNNTNITFNDLNTREITLLLLHTYPLLFIISLNEYWWIQLNIAKAAFLA
uniref:NADH-ubiquinone oxidoreductase chain 4 n=1 Tax=Cercodemas anceps TaxID=2785214 RepID=A0A7S8FIB8_9ECHN|nr:NADH dehydrogenase subunit 4 [Cercodemas anceps]QPD06744.1 NADH dehydrogenase subunit 4 [Cercodemas anceps]